MWYVTVLQYRTEFDTQSRLCDGQDSALRPRKEVESCGNSVISYRYSNTSDKSQVIPPGTQAVAITSVATALFHNADDGSQYSAAQRSTALHRCRAIAWPAGVT